MQSYVLCTLYIITICMKRKKSRVKFRIEESKYSSPSFSYSLTFSSVPSVIIHNFV